MDELIRGLPPIAETNARILILGSMPGAMSLEAGQYYAHPRNAFWRIMGVLVGAGPEQSYTERVRVLKARGIALWDVLDACVRPGSLDAHISEEVPNEFAAFFAAHRGIEKIGLNGGKAARAFKKHVVVPDAADVVRLPSTSPAYAAMSFERKCEAWRAALAL